MPKIKTERFYRSAVVELVGRENDDRRIEVAFSSEEPVERHFGQEVLDHAPESIRLGRLKGQGALLVNHDPNDLVGKVEEINLGSDRIGRATVRFGMSARAQEVYQDVQDGIRTGVKQDLSERHLMRSPSVLVKSQEAFLLLTTLIGVKGT